nr:YsnF/AvaK domain-containing protein [Gammaproteobacteria bacterium]
MMSHISAALYDNLATGKSVVKELTSVKKLQSEDVSLLTYESTGGDASQDTGSETFLARVLGSGRDISDVHNALVKLGVADTDAQHFAEGLRRGHTLVAVQSDEAKIKEIYPVLRKYDPIDTTERAAQWRKAGWTGFQPSAKRFTSEEAAAERKRYAKAGSIGKAGEEKVLPVAEEKLVVGKHEVEHGRVRAYSRVVETPVEERVNLREEHVHVERRPVDRPVGAGEVSAFKEGTVEVTERAEEPVVSKQARVIEEVVIYKDVEQRAEAIHDTVRRTDVQVEDTRHQQPDYAAYE